MKSHTASILVLDRNDLAQMKVGKSFDEVQLEDFKEEPFNEAVKHPVVLFTQNTMTRVIKNRYN